MKVQRLTSRRVRIGIAIGPDALVVHAAPAVLDGGTRAMPLTGTPSADGCWPELDAALLELRALLPAGARASAAIAVMPPLVQLRRIALPPLTPAERRRVLSRDASRWFVDAHEPFVADAVPVAGARGEVMAAGIPARCADAIARAASHAGIDVGTLQAAPWAWAASVTATKRAAAAARAVVVPSARSTDVVWVAGTTVTAVRRFRDGERAAAAMAELLAEHEIAGTVRRLADGLATAGAFAAAARGPELLADSALAARRAVVARRARALSAAAAAMLLLAAGTELWGARRQLAAVRAERAALRARVSRAMASRDSATTLEAQLGAVATEVREAPRWTAAIAVLTERLPDGAWLQSLSAAGDSVSLVGEAAQAGDVFEALRRDPAIAGVRADAPIRRELSADRAPTERYSVTVRLSPAAMIVPAAELR